MVFKMAITIAIGVYIGIKAHEYLKFKIPVATIVFSLAGVFLSIYIMIKDVTKK